MKIEGYKEVDISEWRKENGDTLFVVRHNIQDDDFFKEVKYFKKDL